MSMLVKVSTQLVDGILIVQIPLAHHKVILFIFVKKHASDNSVP